MIIFVTAYDTHAVEAFRVHALDYLLKPLDDGDLARALARADALLAQCQLAAHTGALRAWSASHQRTPDQAPVYLRQLTQQVHDTPVRIDTPHRRRFEPVPTSRIERGQHAFIARLEVQLEELIGCGMHQQSASKQILAIRMLD